MPYPPQQAQAVAPRRPDIVFLQALLCGKASIMIVTKNLPKPPHNGHLRQVAQTDGEPQLPQLCVAPYLGNRTA